MAASIASAQIYEGTNPSQKSPLLSTNQENQSDVQIFQNTSQNACCYEESAQEQGEDAEIVEQILCQNLQQEQQLSELKSRFISMVSHEVRTPLTVIKTSTKLLEQYSHIATTEKKQEYFQRIYSAINTITQLLENVLTINHAEMGMLGFKPTWFDLEPFCHRFIDEMHQLYGERIIFIVQGQGSSVYLDPELLQLIMTNLLSNSLKYSSRKSQVDLCLSWGKEEVIFTIHDTGIGIPDSEQPRLFQPFYRASNVEMVSGIGLGLAIARQCIMQHHGQITFTSQPGSGTTFTVKLPIHQ